MEEKSCYLPLAPRNSFGTLGVESVIRTNHIGVEVSKKIDIHCYEVQFWPTLGPEDSNNRGVIFNLLLKNYPELAVINMVYDGYQRLYTAGPLPDTSKVFSVLLPLPEEPPGLDWIEEEYLIMFSLKPDDDILRAYNTILRLYPTSRYTLVGRSFFDPCFGGDTKRLGDGFVCWSGYYQSVRPTQTGMSLNIDMSAGVFYEPILISEFARKHLKMGETVRAISASESVKLKNSLVGLKFETSHTSKKLRYNVTGLTSLTANQIIYPRIRHFPFELCTIVAGQRCKEKTQVAAFLKTLSLRPAETEGRILKLLEGFNNDSNFGIGLADKFTKITSRVLAPPRLKYHGGVHSIIRPYNGQWNIKEKRFFAGGNIGNWMCVSFSNRTNLESIDKFCKRLIATCKKKGMITEPVPLIPVEKLSGSVKDGLVSIHKIAANLKRPLQILIVILPDEDGSYGLVKRVCETELGIVTQCCKPKQAQRSDDAFFLSLALKMNVKVGGRNHVLMDFNTGVKPVSDKPTIIFGADVSYPFHDSSSPIAAVVASVNWPECTKYKALLSSQPSRIEIIGGLYNLTKDPEGKDMHGGMIRDHLLAFQKSTGHKPLRIIFYRDGVSEVEFPRVLLSEVEAIWKACASLEEGYRPPVTYIVVVKRHHTRFFGIDKNQMDKIGNVLPGTVVDTSICHPSRFDFYLTSHATIRGTSKPTHYNVLFDENNFDADELQSLTNKLCYSYARCTSSVSVVSPVYYAHLACTRGREYIDSMEGDDRPLPSVKDDVKELMFYV